MIAGSPASADELRIQGKIIGACLADPPRFLPIVAAVLNGGAIFEAGLREVYLDLRPTDPRRATQAIIERHGFDGVAKMLAPIQGKVPLGPIPFLLDLEDNGEWAHEANVEELAQEATQRFRQRAAASLVRSYAKRLAESDPDHLDDDLADLVASIGARDLAPRSRLRRAAIELRELLKLDLDAPSSILADGIMTTERFSVLYGRGGYGKSFLALILGLAVARGLSFMGLPTSQMRVGIVSLEDGAYHLADRFRRLLGWSDPPEGLVLVPFDFLGRLPDLCSPRDQAELVAVARDLKLGLTILDPLRLAFSGAEDAEGLAPLIRFSKEFPVKSGSGLLLVHHERKPGVDRETEDDMAALRGAAILGDLAGCLMRLKSGRGNLVLRFPKVSHGPAPDEIWLGRGTDGVLYQIPKPDDPAEKGAANRERVRGLLPPGAWVPLAEIEAGSGLARVTLWRHLKALGAEERKVGRSREYRLADTAPAPGEVEELPPTEVPDPGLPF